MRDLDNRVEAGRNRNDLTLARGPVLTAARARTGCSNDRSRQDHQKVKKQHYPRVAGKACVLMRGVRLGVHFASESIIPHTFGHPLLDRAEFVKKITNFFGLINKRLLY